jgi:hypothetical protein
LSKGCSLASLLRLDGNLQNLILGVAGDGDDFKVTLLAGCGVFRQNLVAFFDLLNRFLACVGLDEGVGGFNNFAKIKTP